MYGAEKAPKRLSHEDYTVGWICPLEVEQIAAVEMLDEEHEQLPQLPNDHNVYTLGSINGHNVVIAGLPYAGNNSAATVVTQMRNTFAELRFGLLVGIGGGVPVSTDNGPIRLGHVVVSKPSGEHSGAIQYDHGKAEAGQFCRAGFLAPPPTVLLNAAQILAVSRARVRTDPLLAHLQRIDTTIRGLRRYKYPGADKDHLYRADYVHPEPKVSCQKCGCDPGQRIDRSSDDDSDEDEMDEQEIVVHRGTIAAGELVVKDGILRDKLAEQHSILCFEMEAAGTLADFPCLVVRGIADYSDSHKNDKWHGYAAATAAAYARQLFFYMPVDEVRKFRVAESDVQQLIVHTNSLVQNEKDKEIMEWLSPPDPSSNYNKALEKRQAGSGHWLLTNTSYEQWKHALKSRLWLHGIPGCGKTILSTTVLKDLRESEKPNHVVLCFYFDFTHKSKQSFDGMLRSLISQLYKISRVCQKHLHDAYSDHKNGNWQPNTPTLVEVLRKMSGEVKDAKIVLDALDECEDRKALLPWFGQISEWGDNLHVLMTSRKEEDIASALSQWISPEDTIRLETSAINDDIREYVQSRVRTSKDLERWNGRPDVQNIIETKLIEKAKGMFRWAACQLDTLGQCYTLRSLEHCLETLPESLDETYHRILAKIPKIHRRDCIRILQLLVYDNGRFTIRELADAIVVEVGHQPSFDLQNRMPDPMEIPKLCSSLISVTQSSWGQKEVELAHFSVKEYLTSSRVHKDFKDDLVESNARAAIVEIMLAYLSCSDLDKIHTSNDLFPFSWHSLDWMYHAEYAEPSNKHLAEPIIAFLRNPQAHKIWKRKWERKRSIIAGPPLYYLARSGMVHTMCQLVKQLIKEGVGIDGEEYRDHLPILGAYETGRKDIVMLLLEHGANINGTQGRDGIGIIFAAVKNHDEDFALQLLEKGADPNSRGVLWREFAGKRISEAAKQSILHQAALQGSTRLVLQLLEKGADINFQCKGNGTALSLAAKHGNTAVVQLLLDMGADPNAEGGYEYNTALSAACHHGYEEIVRLLINKGADVNAPGAVDIFYPGHTNALISASRNRSPEIVKLLLEAGAMVNTVCECFAWIHCERNALNTASSWGNTAVVEILLEAGADVNARPRGWTAVNLSVVAHRWEIVKMLLEYGADPDIQGSNLLDLFYSRTPPWPSPARYLP